MCDSTNHVQDRRSWIGRLFVWVLPATVLIWIVHGECSKNGQDVDPLVDQCDE